MATVAGRNRCVKCGKEKATLRCGGCLQEFCFNHSADHRQELSKQLDEVEVSRDLFRQTLTEQTADRQKHALIQQVNDWEHHSIKTIQQTAEEARGKLLKHVTEEIDKIERSLNTLTKQLQQSREENDFFETDLKHWNEELARLTKELTKPSNIDIQQDTIPLIHRINVNIVSESSAARPKNIRGGRGASAGFPGYRSNNNEETSNPTSRGNASARGGGVGSRGGRGGFHDRRGGFGSINDASSPTCYNCGEIGHTIRECPNLQQVDRGGRGGFNSYGGREGFNSTNRGSGYTPSDVFQWGNQNNDDEAYGEPVRNDWRIGVDNETTNYSDEEYPDVGWTTNTSTSRGGFNNFNGSRGGRGGRGGSNYRGGYQNSADEFN